MICYKSEALLNYPTRPHQIAHCTTYVHDWFLSFSVLDLHRADPRCFMASSVAYQIDRVRVLAALGRFLDGVWTPRGPKTVG